MDDVAARALAAMRAGEWDEVRLLLHPYLHWTLPDGSVLRGRTNVMTMLARTGAPPPPDGVEPRDGQIYRWTC